jgi:hypothetical protein
MSLMSFLNSSNKQKVAVLPDGNASNLDELFTNLIEKTLPKIETVIKWDNLLLEYIQQKDAVFFIRRYASASNKQWDLIRRGFLTEYSSGLKYVFCDNYLAHYFYLMSLKDFVPTITEFNKLIKSRNFPYGYMKTSAEEPYQAYPKGKSVNINKSGWKLAHLYSVNQNDYNFEYKKQSKKLFPRGEQIDWKFHNGNNYPSRRIEQDNTDYLRKITIAHFLRLVHPINYFLVPKIKMSNIDIGENSYLISFMREHNCKRFEELLLRYEELIMSKKICVKDKSDFKFNLSYGLTYNSKSVVLEKNKYPEKKDNIKKAKNHILDYSNVDLSIIKAYLIDKSSYRTIEKVILKIPSPVRGGGFVAKGILNSYGVEGKHKGFVYGKNISELIITNNGVLKETLIKLKEYIKSH